MKVAINGFGRIGRNFLRTVLLDKQALKEVQIIAINIGPASIDMVAHMFKYDTLMGTYPGSVSLQDATLSIDNHRIEIISESDPSNIDWHKRGIDWVVESSGRFTDRVGAQKHLDAGAGAVLITAPAKGEDIVIIPGVNDAAFDASKHHIVSLGSCTTNALIPMLKVVDDAFGVTRGFMTTIHAYTNTQVLLDVENSDVRRSRAAALNIIPTSTGATKMLAKVMPHLADKVGGIALRVPIAKVSLVDLSIETKKEITPKLLNEAFSCARTGSMKGIVGLTHEPLVSSDYNGSDYSVMIDGLLTSTHDGLGKLFGWYDNEWGYSVRLKDFLVSCSSG